MKRDEFEGLIQRLEVLARKDPRRYATRVALLAALGYGYLIGVLVLLLAVTIALIWITYVLHGAALQITIGLGVFTVGLGIVIVRALWVRLPPPQGLEVKRSEAPALFALIDDLGSRLQAPHFHHVLITDEFNAGVMQIPRLGILGWQTNYLLLGWPLLQALAPEQFRSVLAHEFAHLSRNHSRFSAWIYRIRRTWDNVFQQMARRRQSGRLLLVKFIRWYAPYFDAYSFVLARQNEYEADRWAAQLTGKQIAAEALILTQTQGRLVSESFWPGLYQQAAVQQAPPAATFVQLGETLQRGPSAEQASRWLRQALHVPTNNADTHPCLTDRLAGIGFLPPGQSAPPACEVPPLPATRAAEYFLGSTFERYRDQLERRWHSAVAKNWKERFQQAGEFRKKLKELEDRLQQQPLTLPEQWERSQLVSDLQGSEAAEPLLRQMLVADPDHAPANFALGRFCLERDDESGIALIERAMAKDPEAVEPGCNLLYGYYQRTGRREKTRPLVQRFDEHAEQLARAQKERALVTVRDSFIPHGLTDPQVADLRQQFAAFAQVSAVYLVRKDVRHFPDKPFYVLIVKPAFKWYLPRSSNEDSRLAHRLINELKLPGHTTLFVDAKNVGPLTRKISRVPQALIYQRA